MSGFLFVFFHIERFFVPSKIQTNCYIVFSSSWLPKVIAWDPSESWLDELQRRARAWRSRYQLEISTENFIQKKTDPWPALRSFGMGGEFWGEVVGIKGWLVLGLLGFRKPIRSLFVFRGVPCSPKIHGKIGGIWRGSCPGLETSPVVGLKWCLRRTYSKPSKWQLRGQWVFWEWNVSMH